MFEIITEKSISGRIKYAIKESGMSQASFAAWFDMPLSTFNEKISGITSWKAEELAKICLLLNKKADVLLFGQEDYVENFQQYHHSKLMDNLKEFFIRRGDYKSLGKLVAEQEKNKTK